MKRLIPLFLSLLATLTSMGMLCDMSSHNGPTNFIPFDTTAVKTLDTAALISISVLVREWDKQTTSLHPSNGATVKFTNNGTIVLTDSTGFARTTFTVDSIPFRYGYEVKKDGFVIWTYAGWEENDVILDEVGLNKPGSSVEN